MSQIKRMKITCKVTTRGGLFNSDCLDKITTVELPEKVVKQINRYLHRCETNEQFAKKKDLIIELFESAFSSANYNRQLENVGGE